MPGPPASKIEMKRKLSLLTWILVLSSLVTGLTQAWMRYLLEPENDFSAWNHPWQGTVESLHVFLAPILTLLLGYVLAEHAVIHWHNKATGKGRVRSGGALVALICTLILSGAWMAGWSFPEGKLVSWIHGIAGALFGLIFLGHALSRKRG